MEWIGFPQADVMHIEELRTHCPEFSRGPQSMRSGATTSPSKPATKCLRTRALEVARVWLSFKTSDEKFAELVERQDVIPAPYLARAKWVASKAAPRFPPQSCANCCARLYDLVVAKLPRKTKEGLATKTRAKSKSKKSAAKKSSKQKKQSSNVKKAV